MAKPELSARELDLRRAIGARVKELRERKKMTELELGTRLGALGPAAAKLAVKRLESGKDKALYLSDLEQLSVALEEPIDTFLEPLFQQPLSSERRRELVFERTLLLAAEAYGERLNDSAVRRALAAFADVPDARKREAIADVVEAAAIGEQVLHLRRQQAQPASSAEAPATKAPDLPIADPKRPRTEGPREPGSYKRAADGRVEFVRGDSLSVGEAMDISRQLNWHPDPSIREMARRKDDSAPVPPAVDQRES